MVACVVEFASLDSGDEPRYLLLSESPIRRSGWAGETGGMRKREPLQGKKHE
jgi:hypothetical protein